MTVPLKTVDLIVPADAGSQAPPEPTNPMGPMGMMDSQSTTLENVSGLVVIGANGSGKTRFGQRIEQFNYALKPHRIGAQRMLMLPQQTTPRMVAEAEAAFRNMRGDSNSIIQPVQDFDPLLSLIFAKETERDAAYVEASRAASEKLAIPASVADRVVEIWNELFPHRGVRFTNGQVVASMHETTYSASQMSDGERVAVYLLGQVLTAPEDGMLIVDEPELHLHRSIRDSLWNALEATRPDCVFVYITHDVDFAAARPAARTLWLRGYDGSKWTWEEIAPVEGVPEGLLRELVGSRRPILFVEGEAGSLDTLLYTAAYPAFSVQPVGGCTRVIQFTRALRGASTLHDLDVHGMVDRDRRDAYEVQGLVTSGVRVLSVAEVENVLLLPSILDVVADQLVEDKSVVRADVQQLVLSRLRAQRGGQIALHVAHQIEAEVKRALETTGTSAETLRTAVDGVPQRVNVEQIWAETEAEVDQILQDDDYEGALRVVNDKTLVQHVAATVFKLKDQEGENGLSNLVRRLVRIGHAPLLSALRSVLPQIE